MTSDMERRVRKARNVGIALRTARHSVQTLVHEPPGDLEAFPFLDRELAELQRDVWELVQAREKWKAGVVRRIEIK